MHDNLRIVIKREDLYGRIWQTPALQLAREYKMSDSMLARICRKLKVPKPSPGYWMKVEHGKKVRRPPLPPLGPSDPITYEHQVSEKHVSLIMSDPNFQTLIDTVQTVIVPQRLSNPDLLIKNTQKHLVAKDDRFAQTACFPHLNLKVYQDSAGRALRLMDSIIKEFKRLGFRVRGVDSSNQKQHVEILGQRVSFYLKETTKRVDHVLTKEELDKKRQGRLYFADRWDYVPTGKLELSIEVWGAWGHQKRWSDTARKSLEDKATDFILGVISIASTLKREEEERETVRRLEEERTKQRLEEEQRHAKEEARRKNLDYCIESWVKSRRLKAFINEYEKGFLGGRYSDAEKEKFMAWKKWALESADSLDPIKTTLATLAPSLG